MIRMYLSSLSAIGVSFAQLMLTPKFQRLGYFGSRMRRQTRQKLPLLLEERVACWSEYQKQSLRSKTQRRLRSWEEKQQMMR